MVRCGGGSRRSLPYLPWRAPRLEPAERGRARRRNRTPRPGAGSPRPGCGLWPRGGPAASRGALGCAGRRLRRRPRPDRVGACRPRLQIRDSPSGRPFGLVICIASSHAVGGFPDALGALRDLTALGGEELLGEVYWRNPPSEGYLEALGGASADDCPTTPA